jgi:glycogen synthase
VRLEPELLDALRHFAHRARDWRLDDTVHNYDEATGAGTGFKFWDIDPYALYYCIGWAVATWYDRPTTFSNCASRRWDKTSTGSMRRGITSLSMSTR